MVEIKIDTNQKVDQDLFIKKAREANTMVDSFYMIGAKDSDLDLLIQTLKVDKSSTIQLTPSMISSFPSFSRKQIDIDKSNQQELVTSVFPNGIQPQFSNQKPQNGKLSAYQFGSDKRIYIQYFLFYESLDNFELAQLEHELQLIRLKHEHEKAILKKTMQRSEEQKLLDLPAQNQNSELKMPSRCASAQLFRDKLPFSEMFVVREDFSESVSADSEISQAQEFLVDDQNSEQSSKNIQIVIASAKKPNNDESSPEVNPNDDMIICTSDQGDDSQNQFSIKDSIQKIKDSQKTAQTTISKFMSDPQSPTTREAITYSKIMEEMEKQNPQEMGQPSEAREKEILHRVKQLKKKNTKIWIPKAIALVSLYVYYDFFATILEDLYKRLHEEQGSLFEQHLFNIVFKIPAPTKNHKIIYPLFKQSKQFLEISLPGIEELPYANTSHFETLLEHLGVDDIVCIFTHLLFEQKTLLIAPKTELLVPISFALHSLIYPFQMCLFTPCILNDGEESHINSLNLVCNPMNYFIGIQQEDKALAEQFLGEDDFEPPLIIDIPLIKPQSGKPDLQFTFSNTYTIYTPKKCLRILEGGQWRELNTKRSDYKKNAPILPQKLQKNLINKIEAAYREFGAKVTPEFIKKFRQAFFDLIIDLFLNYKRRVSYIEGEPVFDYLRFIDESDPSHKEFFQRYFQLDAAGALSHNQMFNQFLTTTFPKQDADVSEDDRIMIEHIRSAILSIQNDQETSNAVETVVKSRETVLKGSFRMSTFKEIKSQDEELHVMAEVVQCPLTREQILKLYNDVRILPLEINGPLLKYMIFPKINTGILQLGAIIDITEIIEDLKLKATMGGTKVSRAVKITPNSKEGIYVLMSWIYMWCFTLGEQDEKENVFRLNQLKQVIGKLKADYRYNLKVDLFYLLMETCYHHSTYKVSNTIYDTMCRYDVTPDNRIKLMHFDHRREDIKNQRNKPPEPAYKQQNRNAASESLNKLAQSKTTNLQSKNLLNDKQHLIIKKVEQILDPSSNIYKRITYHHKFRKRTFKVEKRLEGDEDGDVDCEKVWEHIQQDEVKLNLQERCSSCTGQLLAPQLRKVVERAQRERESYDCFEQNTTAMCTFCGKGIPMPQLRLTIGKHSSRLNEKTYLEKNFNFLSAESLFKSIQQTCLYESDNKFKKQGHQVPLAYFRQKKEQDFWNLVYYFNEYQLPFEFILPYESDVLIKEFEGYKREQRKQVVKQDQE